MGNVYSSDESAPGPPAVACVAPLPSTASDIAIIGPYPQPARTLRPRGMEDSRGVLRGSCNDCACQQYYPPGETAAGRCWKCSSCGHFPTKHQKLGARKMCPFPGCYQPMDFDLNTGEEKMCCAEHEGYQGNDAPGMADGLQVGMQVQDVEDEDTTYHQYIDKTVVMQTQQYPHPGCPTPYYVTSDSAPVTHVAPPPCPQAQPSGYMMHISDAGYFPAMQAGFPPMTTAFPDQTTGFLPMAMTDQTVQCLVPGMQKCAITECPNPSYTDENGTVHKCCGRTHAREYEQRQLQQPQPAAAPVSGPPGQAPPTAGPTLLPSGEQKCAIPECPNPCFTDGSGTVHECCGITHAMEHQRRKAIQQQQQVVKGVTHCLLPECNNLVWPFKNYCGRSHASTGAQRGLTPPMPQADPNTSTPKDSSLCLIPGCTQKKFSDPSGVTHPFCGKTHAEKGKEMNIQPTADKKEDECELPGCQKPKRKEGTRVHDYCCADHAQKDAPNREARILTDIAEVKKFLDKFPKLKGYTIVENQHAKSGGTLFKRFKQKWDSLPKNQRVTCLGFHGTADKNISSICQNGYDTKLRSGQAYGAGEYFATTPDIPMNYCRGGKRMLLNELLLGQSGTHHTKHSAIIVMKDPAHDLPRFIVSFP